MSNPVLRPAAPKGVSLVEAAIALTVLAIGILGLQSSLVSSMTMAEDNRQEAAAYNYARQKVAELEAAAFNDFSGVYDTYRMGRAAHSWTNPSGGAMIMPGLPPFATGRISFPETSAGVLTESGIYAELTAVEAAQMGMPQDLDGSGGAPEGATNKATSYTVLPVCIVISWDSVSGTRSVNVCTLLTKLK